MHRPSLDFNHLHQPLLRRAALATHDHDGEHGDKQHAGNNPDNDRSLHFESFPHTLAWLVTKYLT
jgi:hypothetical protein